MSRSTAGRISVTDALDDWPDEAPAAVNSPWRPVFEEINRAVGGRRDEVATIGSINWLRHAMEGKDANPNVVRNIIYRDKGRLHDKRALFVVLQELRSELGLRPIDDPALTYLGSPYAAAELEVSQVLGREQRRVYRVMVGGLRAGAYPRLLVVGKSGSGKTMLADYIQRALQEGGESAPEVVRFDFSESDLSAPLVRFGNQLGLEAGLVESRLVRIGTASAFAVQADAQAEVARVLLDHLRQQQRPLALLLHLSHGLNRPGQLGTSPLRLNTPEVPRVTAAEWLWATLIRPLATLPGVALYLSTAAVPGATAGLAGATGSAASGAPWLDGPLKLSAPTTAEARRFVEAHAPQLEEAAREEIVARAGRSYEALRTLSLLALLRRPPELADDEGLTLGRLAALCEPGSDTGLRSFLCALTVLSTPDLGGFQLEDLLALTATGKRGLTSVEQAFLDPVPGSAGRFRSFSRRLVRELQQRLSAGDQAAWRETQRRAATLLADDAASDPSSGQAERWLYHALEARDWDGLTAWLAQHPVPYAALESLWSVARDELLGDERLEDLALEVARQLVRLGAVDHVDAVRAFELLVASERAELRAWAAVLRAQAEVAAGRFERAAVLLDVCPATTDPQLEAERRLATAGVLRWRGELEAATRLVTEASSVAHAARPGGGQAAAALAAKSAVWRGVVAKDRGDLENAIEALWLTGLDDDLIEARLSFQRGDVAFQLGAFDVAGVELDRAVRIADRSGALPQERARFLARRGSLARSRGDLEGSLGYFASARTVLENSDLDALDAAFAHAKVDDEASYSSLAGGDFESAIVAATTAIATYRDYQKRRDVDAGFRITRASLRLAVAYAFRGLGVPYRRPLAATVWPTDLGNATATGNPDLRHARDSLAQLRERLVRPGAGLVTGSSAVRGLLREARLVGSYIAHDAEQALALAEAAVADARFDYQRAEAQAGRAYALLRLGRPDDSLAALAAAGDHLDSARQVVWRVLEEPEQRPIENGDLGLLAQLAHYRAGAQLAAGSQAAAAETLCLALEDERLAPFHEGLLRAFGETAHHADDQGWRRHRRLRSLLGMNGTGPSTPARLPDALVAAWRTRTSARLVGDVS